jgi:hypothetical protein
MSTLAKVFVVFNLVLSLAFFGTSATLFMTREDYGVRLAQVKAQLDHQNEQLRGDIQAKANTIGDQSKAILKLEGSEKNLAVGLSAKKKELTEVQTNNVALQGQVQSANEATAAATKSLAEKDKSNQELQDRLQKAHEDLAKAIEAQRAATEERNRGRRDLDAVNNELHLAKVEFKELSDKYETLELIVQHVKKVAPHLIPDRLAPPIEGIVHAVDDDLKLVVLSVGRDQKVQEGYEFTVYREAEFIGKVKVTRVFSDLAGAEVVFTKDGAKIQPGDKASTAVN